MNKGCRLAGLRSAQAVFLLTGLFAGESTLAAVLTPGQSATVAAGAAPETWALNAATLNVNPGGQTLTVNATNASTLNFSGASTTGGVVVNGSTGNFANSSINAVNAIGLSVVAPGQVPGTGSTVQVTDGVINGFGRGVNVSTGSTVTLTATQVTGSGAGATFVDNGYGLTLVGGSAIVQGASTVAGSNRGALVIDNGNSFLSPSLVVDNATITGQGGSGIYVDAFRGPATPTVILRNGAVVNSANGMLLQVGESTAASPFLATLALQIDNSTLTGNIQAFSSNVANISMSNASTLTGNLTDVTRLVMDNSQLTGDINQATGTLATISLANNSRVTGTIANARSMTLDATSTFNMVNDSSVGDLTLNGGTVNLRAGNAGFRTLTASSLAGAGTFALGTDLAGHLSDLVNITGNAAGDHVLRVQNTGVDAVDQATPQQLVHTGSGSATFAVAGGQVDVGTFVYRLQQQGTDWFLVPETTGDPGEPGEPGGPGDPVISPSTRAVIGVFSAAPTVWYGELATLRSRMGELRNGHEQGGFWARTYGNKYQVSAADQVTYSQTQSGVSLGVDTPVPIQDGQWLVGVMGGYSTSDLNLRLGADGQVNSYYLGLYSTWLSTSGYYVDAVLKANRFHNEADVIMADGVKAKGDYDNYGVGGSVEVGKHIQFSGDWFVEPYVQVASLWVDGENYGLDNGLQARSNHADSLVGKVGTYVGRTLALNRGGFVQPYVRVAAAQEFARSNRVKVNSTTFNDDLSGSRGEIGAGVAAQLSDVLQLHADLDYGNGENIEQPWGINVGLRYSW
jgi:outer membrane autotransporter protein